MSEAVKTEIISWIKTVVMAVVFALVITNFVVVNASVPTGSMENNIMTGDRIVAFRMSYLINDPERFDIVVFKYPKDEEKLYVKRIIGLPGETVNVIDGKVYINDSAEALDDSFVNGPIEGDYGPFHVPEGHYFMMGDNRHNSEDARTWDAEYKYVAENKLLGKVIFKYFRGVGLIK